MAEGSNDTGGSLPMLGGDHDPAQYTTAQARHRFAVAKFYGMGPEGEWTVEEISDALEKSVRQVYRYINESDIGQETREMLAVTEAEWRLDMAIQLRREVKRLESIEQELMQRKKAVPTGYETKSVNGVPTGKRNIKLPDGAAENGSSYELKLPVPVSYETVTDYGADLERVQKEKRQYLKQIAKLLGLNEADKTDIDHTLTERHEEVKVVEFRETDDPYPEADPEEVEADVVDVEDADDG